MRDVIVITILLRTYYNVYLLFYISVETLIFAKVLEQTRLKNIEFMKTMNYSLIRILFALVIGLVLVIWPNAAASYIVITVGVAFLIPGVISLFGYFGRKRQEGEAAPRFPIEGIGSLLFGLWLIVMPEFFADVLMFFIGIYPDNGRSATDLLLYRWHVGGCLFRECFTWFLH